MVKADALLRPNAVQEFRRDMEHLFSTFITASFPTYVPPAAPLIGQPAGYAASPVDIEDRPDHYLITMDAPGVESKNVEVSMAGSMLTVIAHRPPQSDTAGVRLIQERNHESLRRTFLLTEDIDHQGVTATVQLGEVQIRLPKTTPRSVRRITIRS